MFGSYQEDCVQCIDAGHQSDSVQSVWVEKIGSIFSYIHVRDRADEVELWEDHVKHAKYDCVYYHHGDHGSNV